MNLYRRLGEIEQCEHELHTCACASHGEINKGEADEQSVYLVTHIFHMDVCVCVCVCVCVQAHTYIH
jgi:hypothetical protein